LKFSEEVLISTKELEEFMRKEGKDLVWVDEFTPIADESANLESAPETQDEVRFYKGQWRPDMRKYEGIGMIEFADGSVY
jgi:hypothetical protein